MARRTEGVTKIVSERTGTVTWRARWSITTGDGERQWGSRTFKTQAAAKAHLAAQKHAIHAGTYQAPVRLTMAEYAETWFRTMDRSWATSTAYTRRNQWTKYIAPVFGSMQLSTVTRAHCQRFVDRLVNDGLKPHTVRGIHALLSKMLRHAEQDGIIARNPATPQPGFACRPRAGSTTSPGPPPRSSASSAARWTSPTTHSTTSC